MEVSDPFYLAGCMLIPPAMMLCSPLTREYLINYARTLIYTTSMPFPSLAAIKIAYSLMRDGKTEHVGQSLSLISNIVDCQSSL